MSSYNNKKSKVIIRACPKDSQMGTPAAGLSVPLCGAPPLPLRAMGVRGSRVWDAKENTPIFYGYDPISTRSYLPSKTVDKLNAINTFGSAALGHVLED